MTHGYAVMGEAKGGGVRVLRRYSTKWEAEDHPIKLTEWKRVWIDDGPSDAAVLAEFRSGHDTKVIAMSWSLPESVIWSALHRAREAEVRG